jgi:hypothetical protein
MYPECLPIRVHIGCSGLVSNPRTNEPVKENLQRQILLVSQVQLTIIHDLSDFPPIRIDRLDNPIASHLISFRKLVATLILSA